MYGDRKYEPGTWTQIMDRTQNSYNRVISTVRDQLTSFYPEGAVLEVVKKIKEENKYYKAQGYTNIVIDSDGWGEARRLYFYGYRKETDEEFAARLLALDKRQADQRDRDLKDLEVLKKRLGETK